MADASTLAQTRTLVTPEGVDLRVRIATASERALALMIDFFIMVAALIALSFAAAYAFQGTGVGGAGEVVQIIWMLGFFLLRCFYFILFETTPRAATPGKRIMGLRVAARSGGTLGADAVVARNAMRELEIFMPILFLFSQDSLGGVIVLCAIIWCAVFVFFPLFNKDRLRLGDVIAGTWVLKTPRQPLLADLTSESFAKPGQYVFTDAQLDKYGVKELQVLETVLRHSESTAVEAVADRIRQKIGWKRVPLEADLEFLKAYYAALRRRLEQRLLFGVRKADKHDMR